MERSDILNIIVSIIDYIWLYYSIEMEITLNLIIKLKRRFPFFDLIIDDFKYYAYKCNLVIIEYKWFKN